MHNIQQRINTVTQLLTSELTLLEKVNSCLSAFSGMDITDIKGKHKEALIRFHEGVNTVLHRYPFLKTYEDYSLIPEADLNKLIKHIQRLCLKLLAD